MSQRWPEFGWCLFLFSSLVAIFLVHSGLNVIMGELPQLTRSESIDFFLVHSLASLLLQKTQN